MPKTSDPLPTPSTDHDLTHIASKDWLERWDHYACAVLHGLCSFHGAASDADAKRCANHAALVADELMRLRQERAQGHVDQGIVERAKERDEKARGGSR